MTLLASPPAAMPKVSTQDPVLLCWGRDLADQNQADSRDPSRCSNRLCAPRGGYPCHPRRIADRLIAASRAGWPHCWSAWLDALSCGVQPARVMKVASPGVAARRRTARTEAAGD